MRGSDVRPAVRCTVWLAAALVVTGGAAALWACGFEFPTDLVSMREQALFEPPASSFRNEIASLVPKPADALRPAEGYEATTTETAEVEELPQPSAQQITLMRKTEGGEAAYAVGGGLPEDVRLYTAGAVAFNSKLLDQAQRYFQGVVSLGEAERNRRELWAHFMLGRVAAVSGNAEAAATHFGTTRALVRAGRVDKLGLAVASLGEEARLYLRPGTIAKAVKLYAEQAAYGSESGYESLLRAAPRIVDSPDLLDEAIQDPICRRLIVLFAYAVGESSGFDEPIGAAPEQDAAPDAPPAPDPAQSRAEPPRAHAVDRVVAAIDRHYPGEIDGAGWLAAVMYRQDRFDLAERLANRDKSPMAWWVKAKLALRRGDVAAALPAYSNAAKGFPSADASALSHLARVKAETGLLRLSRGEYSEALDLFFGATRDKWQPDTFIGDYWGDAAYVAERVMTIEELKGYVDRSVPAPTSQAVEEALESGNELPALHLRALLARRLMRADKYSEALDYFDDEHVRSVAEEYRVLVDRAHSRWRTRIGRAEAWFAAATIARFDGMELFGYELSPDFSIVDGGFEGWSPDHPPDDTNDDVPHSKPANAPNVAAASADELKRLKSTYPDPHVRFHYRLRAVDHAMAAADLLPQSSQAFAAVLCRATGWILDREPERAVVVYQRYLREGPYVRFARHFGRRCPAPDFPGAGRRVWAVRADMVMRPVKSSPVLFGASGLIVAATFVWFVSRRRRMAATLEPKELG